MVEYNWRESSAWQKYGLAISFAYPNGEEGGISLVLMISTYLLRLEEEGIGTL
jgi:hypothetical protein